MLRRLGGTSTAGGVDNRFKENSISANGGLGIDIGAAGQNTNDPLLNFDSDNGPNDLQNHPIILAAERNIVGSNTIIRVRLESAAAAEFLIELFENGTNDGEGAVFLGSQSATTSGGVVEREFQVSTAVGQYVTATATEVIAGQAFKGSTSEFSPTVKVTTGVRPKVSDVKVKSSSLGLGSVDD
ncbi:MAG: hypothetical protein SGJ19_29140 [Planctomycetia bacterium]|nr:hypothetical protein [Planctomycetia bacterium]